VNPRSVVSALDRWIFGVLPADPRSLGIYRILVGAYFVLFIAPVVAFPSFPSSFYAPPLGPFRLLGAPPPSWFFLVVSAGMSVSSVALLLGYRTTVASLTTGLLGFLGDGFVYSFGKIDHNFILVFAVPIIMAASGWGREYSVDRLRRPSHRAVEAWPTSLLALLLGFMMFTAGLPKLLTGWLNPSTHAAQGHFLLNYLSGRHEFLAPYSLHLQNGAFWELLDDITVVFEVGFLLAILSRTSLRLFCAVAILFHTAILLMMNIDFTPNLVAYAAFVDWSAVFSRLRLESVTSSLFGMRTWLARGPWAAVLTAGAGAGLCAATYLGGAPLLQVCLRSLHLGPLVPSLFICIPASLVAIIYLARVGWKGLRSRVRRPLVAT
jgi:uncharacterized membrane protein YphA (DoxX/SURF4 family)